MIANVSALVTELKARTEAGKPVTIGLAGAGQMGTDIIVQLSLMPGLRLAAISEVRTDRARNAALLAGHDAGNIAIVKSVSEIDRAIENGKLAITDDLASLAAAGRIDVVIDATGNPNTGTTFALDAIRNGKHVVMLNVEADITIGRHLKAQAASAGVVYTGAMGDEPACAIELIGFAQSLGLKIVCAGKGKNNPLKFDAVPGEYEAEAKQRNAFALRPCCHWLSCLANARPFVGDEAANIAGSATAHAPALPLRRTRTATFLRNCNISNAAHSPPTLEPPKAKRSRTPATSEAA